MSIKSINLEKTEFLIDLERNMFLVPKELLKDCRVSIDDRKIFSEEGMTQEQKNMNMTQYLPLILKVYMNFHVKLHPLNVLDNQLRQNVVDYIYNKKWSDIKPSEVNMIGLFLYDFVRADEQHGADVTGYQVGMSPVSNYSFNMNYSSSGMRTSAYSKETELSRISQGYSQCSNLGNPLNALAGGGDNLSLSPGAQQLLKGGMMENTGYSSESNIGSTMQNLMMEQTFNDLLLQQMLEGMASGGIPGTGGLYGASQTGDRGETSEADSQEAGETDESDETGETSESEEAGETGKTDKASGDSWLWNDTGEGQEN